MVRFGRVGAQHPRRTGCALHGTGRAGVLVALDADGRILLAGSAVVGPNVDIVVVRLTDAGLGCTKETLVFTPAGTDDGFATFHLGAKFEKKVFATSVFTSELNISDSFKDTQNYLAVWRNGFTTNLSARLALKVGYDLTYKNKPASVAVDVVQTPVATPPVILGQVPFQLRKTDTVFTTSLVISF